ncbi:DUF4307 domain-containing protein [Cellulomonas sp. ATA003]|uniref:DUF4307 domain-containing protein n=1 Tax=Cellulomonas sp. ATA003 TaxID=3073064 RepID=UPI002872D475|nr:DUF4307 domain-containing protein [Cellulomonas sp. ATA003]WNB85036.1 DUF4307 domain-containing protein [Cellulomonas sp. ATA003]
MSETTAPRTPAGRYGPEVSPRRRAATRVGMAALGAGAVALAVWIGLGAGNPEVSWEDVGYSVQGPERVDVTFRVTKDADATASCTLTALSQSYAQVGVVTATVGPASGRVVEQTVPVATQELAVTGVVDGCEIVEPSP